MEKDITNKDLAKLIDNLALSTKNGFETIRSEMASKIDLQKTELKLQTQISGIEVDLRSFKEETRDNFKELNEKFDDLSDTSINYDKRIAKLEDKVFA